jgi:hypothetical protein
MHLLLIIIQMFILHMVKEILPQIINNHHNIILIKLSKILHMFLIINKIIQAIINLIQTLDLINQQLKIKSVLQISAIMLKNSNQQVL